MPRTQALYICQLSGRTNYYTMRLTVCIAFLLSSLFIAAQQVSIIPQPKRLTQPDQAGAFSITAATVIVPEGNNTDKSILFLNDYLQRFYQFKLKVVKASPSPNAIRINILPASGEPTGSYKMDVTFKGIYITGNDENGLFYGFQTLIQLLPVPDANLKTPTGKLDIPFVNIVDAPRFTYRGMHLDVARHFEPVSFVKKYIDYLALHKFNKFHWHLTDDQGWRIEIKKYPKLTAVGAWRNGTIIGRYPGTGNDSIKYGGYYTQAEIKEVVKYAADRFIDVIPEIEMPGHASAAIAAYPQLSCFPNEPSINYFPKKCTWYGDDKGKQVQQTWGVFDDVFCAGNDSTYKFLDDVLDEVMALFPSKYIHVGGDECPKENWKKCDKCQQLIRKRGMTDEHQLQSYFIQRMEKHLNDKGRTLIGWDEILEGGLAPNAVVMSWRGETGGIQAAQEGHQVIMTPGNPVYFDHTQSDNEDSITIGGFNPLEKVYAYEPIPEKLMGANTKYIMGAQANVWAEYMKNSSKVEYMIFPRMAALSEVLWSLKENKNWESFEKKLMTQFKRYDLWKANYSKAYFELKTAVIPTGDNKGVLWKLETKSPGNKINYNKALEINDPPNPPAFNTYTSPVLIVESGKYSAWSSENGKNLGNTINQKFSFNKATGKKITLTNPASDKYPGDGAFTLVNGIINEKGLAKSKEFLGFSGTDCEAIIDLGKEEVINALKINFLDQRSSWIYPPGIIDIYLSNDGVSFKESPNEERKKEVPGEITRYMDATFYPAASARYIKVVAKNYGTIPDGDPGAGNKAWLFVDEIEVK